MAEQAEGPQQEIPNNTPIENKTTPEERQQIQDAVDRIMMAVSSQPEGQQQAEISRAIEALPILANSTAMRLEESPTGPFAIEFQMHLNSRLTDLAYQRTLAKDPSLAEAIRQIHEKSLPKTDIADILSLPDRPSASAPESLMTDTKLQQPAEIPSGPGLTPQPPIQEAHIDIQPPTATVDQANP